MKDFKIFFELHRVINLFIFEINDCKCCCFQKTSCVILVFLKLSTILEILRMDEENRKGKKFDF